MCRGRWIIAVIPVVLAGPALAEAQGKRSGPRRAAPSPVESGLSRNRVESAHQPRFTPGHADRFDGVFYRGPAPSPAAPRAPVMVDDRSGDAAAHDAL